MGSHYVYVTQGSFVKILKVAILIIMVSSTSALYAGEELGYKGKTFPKGKSIAKLLIELNENPDVNIRKNKGWTIASSEKLRTIWSFVPKDHEAYPSYVKREMVERDATFSFETTAESGAGKQIRDKLVQDFIK